MGAVDTQTETHASQRHHLRYIVGIAVLYRVIAVLAFLRIEPLRPLRLIGFENIAIALSIHAGHGYSSPFLISSGPTALLAPGYPLLIAAVMHFFGSGPAAEFILIALNLVFSILTLLVVVKTARQYFGSRVANFAGLIYAIGQPLLFAPMQVWDTCLSALLLMLAFVLVPNLLHKRAYSIGLGVGSAVAILVNPALLPSLVAIFTWSAWRARRTPWPAIVAFLIAFSPWPIRNAITMHAFIPFRSSLPYEFWMGNRPGANGELQQNRGPGYEPAEASLLVQKGELGYLKSKESLARSFVKNHPGQFVRLTTRRFFLFWTGASDSSSPFTVWLTILGMIGLAMLWKHRMIFTLFALPLVLFPLPYYVTHVSVRYQFVVDPLLTILGGYACECFFAWCARRPAPLPSLTATVS